MPNQIEPGAEFQSLPLEFIVSSPLVAAVKAQRVAAETTIDFVKSFFNDISPPAPPAPAPAPPKVFAPVAVELQLDRTVTQPPVGGLPPPAPVPSSVKIKVPIISLINVPNLQIDSLTINFRYEISQTYLDKNETKAFGELSVTSGPAIAAFVSASLKGGVNHSHSDENTVHRGGTLDISVRASQTAMPAGLDRLLSILSKGIE